MPSVDPQAFWALVERGDGCWEWQGSRDPDGYGRHGRHGRAHRTAWELSVGPIPTGLWVLHRCDNPPCVRPDHLFLGTVTHNNRDMRAKGRNVLPKVNATGERHGTHTKPEAFPRGEQHHTHRRPETRPFGERNGQAVLTEAAVRDIRARRRQGERVIALAGAFGISVRAIRFVVDRQTWSQVEDE